MRAASASGIAPALAVATALDIPLVYAKKYSPEVEAPALSRVVPSPTKGGSTRLVISGRYLTKGMRVALVDDFLANGRTALALARRGITVNAVSPCFVEDSVLNTLPPEVQDFVRRWHERGWTPMGRLGTPADIGKAVRLLCSEDAGFITGQVITVDGGASLMNAEVPTEIQLG